MPAKRRSTNFFWPAVVAVFATLAAVEIPIRLLYEYEGRFLTFLDWGFTAVFFTDLIVRLRLAGWRIVASDSTAPTPYGRWWFAVDLLAVIPFRLVPGASLFQLLRLLKLARVAELMRQWRNRALHQANWLRLIFFAFWLGLLAHWIACGWLALRGFPPEFTKETHYLRALYWCITTMATVGYGDITPSTNPQIGFAMIVMILGVGIYGYVIGNVANILANIDPAKVRYREMIERLSSFMKYRNIPLDLQRRILDYNAYLWDKRLGYDESTAIAGLPPSLKGDILLYLNREIIGKVPLFKGAGEELIRAIAMEMRPVIFTPGDYVVRAGEPGAEMYFISRGAVEIISSDGHTVFATLVAGDFFGEMALLFNQPRAASARAVEYCDLYLLEKQTFDHILARFPSFSSHIEEVAAKRKGKPVEAPASPEA